MKHLDLFSGIGGFALAASWVWEKEHDIHSFVEIDPFCQKVLKKHWPGVPIHSDIKEYKHDGTAIDLLTGGFPCQPFSTAGNQRGTKDDRYLWPRMLQIISEIQPSWIIGENVAGLVSMALDNMLIDLENAGYSVQPFILPACAVNASHKRNRVWIVANIGSQPDNFIGAIQENHIFMGEKRKENRVNFWGKYNGTHEFTAQPKPNETPDAIFCRENNGISREMDRNRVKSLGNAIVPQVAIPIMQAIKQLDTTRQIV